MRTTVKLKLSASEIDELVKLLEYYYPADYKNSDVLTVRVVYLAFTNMLYHFRKLNLIRKDDRTVAVDAVDGVSFMVFASALINDKVLPADTQAAYLKLTAAIDKQTR